MRKRTLYPISLPPNGQEKVSYDKVIIEKLKALLDRFGIPGDLNDPATGWKLALGLAIDNEKGFGHTYRPPPKPRHRPQNLRIGARNLNLCLLLIQAELDGRSVRATAEKLAKEWRDGGVCDLKAESLRKTYRRFKKEGPTEAMLEALRILGDKSEK